MNDYIEKFLNGKERIQEKYRPMLTPENYTREQYNNMNTEVLRLYKECILEASGFQWTKTFSEIKTIDDALVYMKEYKTISAFYRDFFESANKIGNKTNREWSGTMDISFEERDEADEYYNIKDKLLSFLPDIFSFEFEGEKIYCKPKDLKSKFGGSSQLYWNGYETSFDSSIVSDIDFSTVKAEESYPGSSFGFSKTNNIYDFIAKNNISVDPEADEVEVYEDVYTLVENDVLENLREQVKDYNAIPSLCFIIKYGQYPAIDEDFDFEDEDSIYDLASECVNEYFVHKIANYILDKG